MTPPTPHHSQPNPHAPNPRPGDIYGVDEVQGALVLQTAPAARLSHILVHAAQELFDAATVNDAGDMWEEARIVASRILASCPMEPGS